LERGEAGQRGRLEGPVGFGASGRLHLQATPERHFRRRCHGGTIGGRNASGAQGKDQTCFSRSFALPDSGYVGRALKHEHSTTYIIGTAGLYCPRAYAADPYSPACRAVWTVGRTASANSSADVSLSRLHCSAAPVIAQLTMVAFSSGDLAL
jgi:hypothetical protein